MQGIMILRFWKYEGAGNDFILIDGRNIPAEVVRNNTANVNLVIPGEIIRELCDRHTGIGADGLMILSEEQGYDFRMRYYNADGGEVNMCGNGGRCISLFAHHLGIGGIEKKFIGRDGEHIARIISEKKESAIIELGMIDVESYEYRDKTFFLNTGVPHYIEFVDNIDTLDIVGRGREIRYSERFKPQGGTNVNFIEIIKHGQIKIRTYERGVESETQACGTGAVASAIATHLYAQEDCNMFSVIAPGGNLDITFNSNDNQHFKNIKLTGQAKRVFTGEINIGNLISD